MDFSRHDLNYTGNTCFRLSVEFESSDDGKAWKPLERCEPHSSIDLSPGPAYCPSIHPSTGDRTNQDLRINSNE